MTEPIKFTFTLTRTDYLQAARSFITKWKTPRARFTYYLVMILSIGLTIYTMTLAFMAGLILFCALSIIYLFTLFFYPLILANQAMKTEQFRGEITFLVCEPYIEFKMSSSQGKLDWTVLGKIYESPDYYFLVWKTTGRYYLIPKRAIVPAEQLAAFRSILHEKASPVIHIL
jgi:hypothetical protein